jgi:hypothetical protein
MTNGQNGDTKRSAQTYVLSMPFPIVDAWIDSQLRRAIIDSGRHLMVERKGATSGSAYYDLWLHTHPKNTYLITFEVRMISLEQTYIAAFSIKGRHMLPEQTQLATEMLPLLIDGIYAEQEAIHLLAAATPKSSRDPLVTEDFVESLARLLPKRDTSNLGRPTVAHNEWARQQLAAGRERAVILKEYLDRVGIDLKDEEAVERGKDRFRKAISRTKRT